MENIFFMLPFNNPVKHFRVMSNHVAQLGIAGIGAEPASVSPAVTINRRKQTMLFTKFSRVSLGVPILGEKTNFVCTVQPRKAFRLIGGNSNIADGIRRQRLVLLPHGIGFTLSVRSAHSSPRKASLFSLMRSTDDNVMKDVIIGFRTVKDREFNTKFLFAERLEPVIDEVSMFRDFSGSVLVEHHLAEHNFIQRIAMLCSQ